MSFRRIQDDTHSCVLILSSGPHRTEYIDYIALTMVLDLWGQMGRRDETQQLGKLVLLVSFLFLGIWAFLVAEIGL